LTFLNWQLEAALEPTRGGSPWRVIRRHVIHLGCDMAFEQAPDPDQAAKPPDQPSAHGKGSTVCDGGSVPARPKLEDLLAAHERAAEVLEADSVVEKANNLDGPEGHRAGLAGKTSHHDIIGTDDYVRVIRKAGLEAAPDFTSLDSVELNCVFAKPQRWAKE
jgi:hypothetical protein